MTDEQNLYSPDRFEADASRYADYLQTTEGRLRLDLAWMNLRDFLEATEHGGAGEARTEESGRTSDVEHGGALNVEHRRALDVGGGTGALASRLAAAGWHVTVVDASASMLALAASAANRSGVAARIDFRHADAANVTEIFAPESFDLVACHNVLEYVADPSALVRSIRSVLAPRGLASLLARNRAGEAMRACLKSHDLDAARNALVAPFVTESLYGGAARLFDSHALGTLAADALLDVIAVRGVRVVADYLPASFSDTEAAYARLLSFEHDLGARPDFAAVARYTQIIARASATARESRSS